MSNAYTGVMAKVKAALPRQIGTNARYDEATVVSLILAADRATRDLCEVHYATAEISLVNDTISYDVPSYFVSLNKVEFALDGTNYDWILQSRSLSDLDSLSVSWRTDRSTRPDFYALLSAVGVQDNGTGAVPSQIVLYPGLTSAGSSTIKLTGVVVPAVGGFITASMPEDVQVRCHVPFVLSVLMATESPSRAAEYHKKWLQGCEETRARFVSQYKDSPSRV